MLSLLLLGVPILWVYPAGDGYDGILIEQLALLEKQHQIKTQVIDRKNWKRCQVDVTNGQIDMILGANKTEEREKVLAYLEKPAWKKIRKEGQIPQKAFLK